MPLVRWLHCLSSLLTGSCFARTELDAQSKGSPLVAHRSKLDEWKRREDILIAWQCLSLVRKSTDDLTQCQASYQQQEQSVLPHSDLGSLCLCAQFHLCYAITFLCLESPSQLSI